MRRQLSALVHRPGLTRDEFYDAIHDLGGRETNRAGSEWFWYEIPAYSSTGVFRAYDARALLVVQFYEPASDVSAGIKVKSRFGWQDVADEPKAEGYVQSADDVRKLVGPLAHKRFGYAAVEMVFHDDKRLQRIPRALVEQVRNAPFGDVAPRVAVLVDALLAAGVEF